MIPHITEQNQIYGYSISFKSNTFRTHFPSDLMAIFAARLSFLSLFLLFTSPHLTFSVDSPSPSPSPALSPTHSLSARAPSPAPASSPLASSPPAPTPQNPISGSSPAPSPVESSSLISHEGLEGRSADSDSSSGGGMSGRKKVGIAIGVIVAATVVVLAGMGFKKRQQNIRRAQYRYAARGEFL